MRRWSVYQGSNCYNVNGDAVVAGLARALHAAMVAAEAEVREVDPSRSAWLECHAWEEAIWTLAGEGRWDRSLPPAFRGRHLPRRQRFDAVAFDEAAG